MTSDIAGLVNRVRFQATANDTVFDVWTVSLCSSAGSADGETTDRPPAAARARPPRPVPEKPARPGADLVAAARFTAAFWFGLRGVREFFDAYPEVGLVKSDLTSVPGLDEDNVLQRRLQGLQRMARVSAEPTKVDELYRTGCRPASAITRKGRGAFIAVHADALGERAKAAAVYEKAAHGSSPAMAVYARFSPAFNRNLQRVLPTVVRPASSAVKLLGIRSRRGHASLEVQPSALHRSDLTTHRSVGMP